MRTFWICLSILCAGLFAGLWPVYHQSVSNAVFGGPFRPKPPIPAPPAPVLPLEPNDEKLFGRLTGRFEQLIDRRQEKLCTQLVDALDKTTIDGEVVFTATDEPQQFAIGVTLLSGAIAALVKRLVLLILDGLIVAGIIRVFWKHWTVLLPIFVGAIGMVAGPIAWAGGKLAVSPLEKEVAKLKEK